MLISVHVPKCAGTSFRIVLQKIYGDRFWGNYGTIFSREQACSDLVPAGTECIHGHFNADAFDSLFPEARLITWVRHPVERLVSNYYFFLRHPQIPDLSCKALHEKRLSLREFADMDWTRNLATRLLARKRVEDLAFVGIAERFDDSLYLFGKTFGFGSLLPAPWDNVNPDRTTPRYQLPTGDYQYILDRNADDLAWYYQAIKRLDEAVYAGNERVA